ncbi:hypothetical protein ACFX13_036135 [Malus domestica]
MNSPNPNSLKSRFTKGLVKALIRINKNHPRSSSSSSSISSSPREIRRRYHKIKTAAYASMACAVGRRRAWSRALLWKIRNKACNGGVVRRSIDSRSHYSIKKRVQQNKVNELRKVVPGGEGMDTWSLLEETAHYMKCLTTQIASSNRSRGRIDVVVGVKHHVDRLRQSPDADPVEVLVAALANAGDNGVERSWGWI